MNRSLAALLILLPQCLLAQAGYQELKDAQAVAPLVNGLSWFRAESGAEDVEGILRGDWDGRFRPAAGGTIPLDFGTVWIRVRVMDLSSEVIDWAILLDEWSLREIRLYRPSPFGDWEASFSGSSVAERQRELPGRVFQFHLGSGGGSLSKQVVQTLYLRVSAPHSSVRLPLYVGASTLLMAKQHGSSVLISLLAGAYSLLVLVCLVLFLGVVERVYAITTVFALLILANYLLLTGLMTGPLGAPFAEQALARVPELTLVYVVCSLTLLLAFIKSDDILPRAYLATRLFMVAMMLLAIFLAFQPDAALVGMKTPIMFLAIGFGAGFRLVVPLLAIVRGRRSALIYLVAFAFEIGGTVLYGLRSTGLIPNSEWLTLASMSGGGLQLLVILYGTTILVRRLRRQLLESNHRLLEANQDLESRVYEQTAALEGERNKLSKLAMEDDLTGLMSRRAIMARLEEEHGRFVRYGNRYVALMIDLDYFKLVNDSWGHAVGDAVLRGLAAVLRECLRSTDLCGRIGGEEFLVVLPHTDASSALGVAEKIRNRLADRDFEGSPDRHFSISCSIGLAEMKPGHPGWERLLQEADSALYQAKHAGRNQSVVSSS